MTAFDVQPASPAVEPFTRDKNGKPAIPLEASALYSFGSLIRQAEELLLSLFSKGLLSGTTHTCLGQEFCQMAVVRALHDPNDAVFSNHRNHGHFLTYSGNFIGLIAEIMGRAAGVCGGIGGSQHLAFRGFHSNGVQAGMTAIGVGQALARRLRGESGIVAIVVGDGTLGQGLLYESLNLASIWKAPVLFVVENNGIAQTTPTSDTIGGGSILPRGAAFGLETWRLNDAEPNFFGEVEQIVERVRERRAPGFLVIDTMRLGPHSKGDDLRDSEEMRAIRERDPLARLGDRLPASVRQEIERATHSFIATVEQAAHASPEARYRNPPVHLFTNTPAVELGRPEPARQEGNVRSVLNRSLRKLLTSDSRVILLGEDMHDPYGGAFKVTAGLSSEFPKRVISTPISEAGVVGSSIGLALAGFRPIAEIMFADFVTLAMDQIYNHAVKFPGMFPGAEVPLVVRTPSGGRRGYGPTHSQSPENLMAGVPGLTVVFPSNRHAAGTLLERAVLSWPYPTIFFEHKLVYGLPCDAGSYREAAADAGDAAAGLFPTLISGSARPDITLVGYGGILPILEKVAATLEEDELEVEIIVPSLLAPLPRRTLTALLLNRERILVAEEGHSEYGFAAELGAALLEAGHSGSFVRIGTPPVPVPAARSLEADVIPSEKHILEKAISLVSI
ncbi:MAG TPA: thiamine pyrophosphate-dependent enzyme [Bryobacteraceae bacterium]